jgi:hypothetical protein
MTIQIKITDIPPDLRFAVATLLSAPGGALVIPGLGAIRADGCLLRREGVPAYLQYSDRDAVIEADGFDLLELRERLSAQLRGAAETGPVTDLGRTVILLDALDRSFRDSNLWRGNIYLAGVAALSSLARVAGLGTAEARWSERLLRELAALELVYLFPVAGKFRLGMYDGQVQYRLNGWGRLLAVRLASGRTGARAAERCYQRIMRHLASQRARYTAFLTGLDIARQNYDDDRLSSALKLPIPVLA